MTIRDALALALFALAAAACSKGCGEDVPDPDICSGPRDGSIDSAELGDGNAPDGFTPFDSGQMVRFLFSEDGDATLPIVFRLTGDDVPACVDHRTELLGCPAGDECGDELTSHTRLIAPLHTYPLEGGGGSETEILYLRLDRDNEPDDGARLELVSEIAGVDVSVSLTLE